MNEHHASKKHHRAHLKIVCTVPQIGVHFFSVALSKLIYRALSGTSIALPRPSVWTMFCLRVCVRARAAEASSLLAECSTCESNFRETDHQTCCWSHYKVWVSPSTSILSHILMFLSCAVSLKQKVNKESSLYDLDARFVIGRAEDQASETFTVCHNWLHGEESFLRSL
jgi:hypothetical protein